MKKPNKVTVRLLKGEDNPVTIIGHCNLATGQYTIESTGIMRRHGKNMRVIRRQSCVLVDHQSGEEHAASEPAKAWKHLRFVAGINSATENTTGWKGFQQ